jgi:hypothetical protein
VNVKSTSVTNYEANPRVLTSGYIAGGGDTIGCAVVTSGASDSNTSTYRFGFIPSGVRVSELQLINTVANTSGTDYDVGLLFATADGGGSIATGAEEIFAQSISMVTTRLVMTDILAPSILDAGPLATNLTLRVWELLSLAADPFKEYHLTITANTVGSVGTAMGLQWAWVR